MRKSIVLTILILFSIFTYSDTLLRLKAYRDSGDIFLDGKKAGKLGGGFRGIRLKVGEHIL